MVAILPFERTLSFVPRDRPGLPIVPPAYVLATRRLLLYLPFVCVDDAYFSSCQETSNKPGLI